MSDHADLGIHLLFAATLVALFCHIVNLINVNFATASLMKQLYLN